MTGACLSDARLAEIRAAWSGRPDVDELLAHIDHLEYELMAHQVSDGYDAGYGHGTLATLDRVARDMGLDGRTGAEDSANWGRQVLENVARLAARRNEAPAALEAAGERGGFDSCSPNDSGSGSAAAS